MRCACSQLLSRALASRGVRVIDLFRDWDEDGSGVIDKEEFFRGMAPLGINVTREEASELFDEFDADGSGEIEFRELNKLLRQRLKKASRSQAHADAASSIKRPPHAQPRSHAAWSNGQASSTGGQETSKGVRKPVAWYAHKRGAWAAQTSGIGLPLERSILTVVANAAPLRPPAIRLRS